MVAWKTASSVIVVSRTTGRVLVMQRGATAKFMPNALVFPGGVVTPSDEKLGHPAKIAAMRELFEETGLLLGQKESAANSPELEALQENTRKDPEQFKLACPSPPVKDLLEWNTWLTPSTYKRRYMTSFFIAQLDGEPEVRMCEREMSHYFWMAPEDCLKKASRGEVILPPPQVYELTRLSQTSGQELQNYSNRVHVMCPQNITTQSSLLIASVLPGDHLYLDEDSFNQPLRSLPSDVVHSFINSLRILRIYNTDFWMSNLEKLNPFDSGHHRLTTLNSHSWSITRLELCFP
nr:NUDIX hydrolase domain containing protein [Haemonchus contortus]